MTNNTICIIGLGYVGLPLAVEFDRTGESVIGYDVDQAKVDALRAGTDTTGNMGDATVAACGVTFTTDPTLIGDAGYVIITVPTPVDELQDPNLSYVVSAAQTVGTHMHPGTTVVLESTVFPGVTRDVLIPALEEASGLTVGADFRVGYSPERVSPGDGEHDIPDVVKIVSGYDDETRDDLVRLYEKIVRAGVYPAPDLETAETAKVIENVQRDINIALVNELSLVCENLGLNTQEVLKAAGTKWNFHREYTPGLVGGHCIPVDPMYLVYRSKRDGFVPKLILQAREINEYMPKHTAMLTLKALNQSGKTLRDSRVLVLGLTYKPNNSDVRTSKVQDVIDELKEFNVDVVGYDPHVDPVAMRDYFDIEVQETLSFEGFDGVILATAHDEFANLDLGEMAAALNDSPVIMDVMGVLDPEEASTNRFTYRRL